jgi:hypothetical protein
MFKGINAIDFSKRFQTNNDCYQYLESIKGNGYACSRCGCNRESRVDCFIIEDVRNVVMMKVLQQIIVFMV